MPCRIFFIFVICCVHLYGSALNAEGSFESKPSFFNLLGNTGWEISLTDFAVSTAQGVNVFELRLQDQHHLRYSAYRKDDAVPVQFGPLQAEHAAELYRLLEYALFFGELKKNNEFTMNVNWELYPQSIRKWAEVWRDSGLRKEWEGMDQHARYPLLVKMITDFIKEDKRAFLQGLGFEAAGASMEKMRFLKAQQLKCYHGLLEPSGIKLFPLSSTKCALTPINPLPSAKRSLTSCG